MNKHLLIAGATAFILSSCTNDLKESTANPEPVLLTQAQKDIRNKETGLKCISAYAAQDSNYILSNTRPDVVNVYSGRRPIHGLDSCRILLREAFNIIRSYQSADQVALADSNYVFVFQNVDVTTKTGELSHVKRVEIFKFDDAGKIAFHTAVSEAPVKGDRRVTFTDSTLPETAVSGVVDLPKNQAEKRNRAVVFHCFAAYAAKDSNYLLTTNTNDVANIYAGRPWVRGADSARAVLRQAFNDIKNYSFDHQVVLADGHYVFVFQYVDMSFTKNAFLWHAKQVEMFKFNDAGKLIVHTAVNEDLLPGDEKVPF